MKPQTQRRVVGTTQGTVTSATGLRVTVIPGEDCEFTPEARQPRSPGSRMLTEDLQLRATGAGGFDYTVELPG